MKISKTAWYYRHSEPFSKEKSGEVYKG